MIADSQENDRQLVIRYAYTFEDGHVEHHEVRLDADTLELIDAPPEPLPDWTRLENHQCPDCPLSSDQVSHCPAALAVVKVAQQFGHCCSYSRVKVQVDSPSRTISKENSLQEGLFPLLGLRMATSGCPALQMLRPMARFHLPFADSEETCYRAISMYLVGQLLRRSRNLPADFELQELQAIYGRVHRVNLAFSRRLAEASSCDANVNSLTTLDMFAQDVPLCIEGALGHLDRIFSPYLSQQVSANPGRPCRSEG